MFGHLKFSESMALEVARDVVSGRIASGSALPTEGDLSERFGVSKPISRECIQVLAGLGILRAQQGKRSVALSDTNWNIVSPIVQQALILEGNGRDLITQIYEVRLVLETSAAGWAAERATASDLKVLSDLTDQMAAIASASGDRDRYVDADFQFHEAIAQASLNAVLRSLLRSFHGLLAAIFLQSPYLDLQKTSQEHVVIAQAVASGRSSQASEAMTAHILSAREFDLSNLMAMESQFPTISFQELWDSHDRRAHALKASIDSGS